MPILTTEEIIALDTALVESGVTSIYEDDAGDFFDKVLDERDEFRVIDRIPLDLTQCERDIVCGIHMLRYNLNQLRIQNLKEKDAPKPLRWGPTIDGGPGQICTCDLRPWCPNCNFGGLNRTDLYGKTKRCPECGQMLDWGIDTVTD